MGLVPRDGMPMRSSIGGFAEDGSLGLVSFELRNRIPRDNQPRFGVGINTSAWGGTRKTCVASSSRATPPLPGVRGSRKEKVGASSDGLPTHPFAARFVGSYNPMATAATAARPRPRERTLAARETRPPGVRIAVCVNVERGEAGKKTEAASRLSKKNGGAGSGPAFLKGGPTVQVVGRLLSTLGIIPVGSPFRFYGVQHTLDLHGGNQCRNKATAFARRYRYPRRTRLHCVVCWRHQLRVRHWLLSALKWKGQWCARWKLLMIPEIVAESLTR